jgi:predicted enzyme related to lactoylglutathione lyase
MNYKLGITILFVRDLPAEQKFYTEKFGFPYIAEGSDEHFALFGINGETAIALQGIARASEESVPSAGSVELGLVVEDVDAVYRDWQSKGIQTLTAPQDLPFGRSFDARDPEGHLFTVYKPS